MSVKHSLSITKAIISNCLPMALETDPAIAKISPTTSWAKIRVNANLMTEKGLAGKRKPMFGGNNSRLFSEPPKAASKKAKNEHTVDSAKYRFIFPKSSRSVV